MPRSRILYTIHDLVTEERFGLRYSVPNVGAQRPVTWVHVVDLDDPWNWVERGTLLLTTGAGVPVDSEQSAWLTRIIHAGASGVVIAAQDPSHTITEAALEVSRQHDFPVLYADFALRFSELARHIVNHTVSFEQERNQTIRRVYEQYAGAIHLAATTPERFELLAKALGIRFTITDSAGELLYGSSVPQDQDLSAPLRISHDTDTETFTLTASGAPLSEHRNHLFEHLKAVVRLELRLALQQAEVWLEGQSHRAWHTLEQHTSAPRYVCALLLDDRTGDIAALLHIWLAGLSLSPLRPGQLRELVIITAHPEAWVTELPEALRRSSIGVSDALSAMNPPEHALLQAQHAAKRAPSRSPQYAVDLPNFNGILPDSPAAQQHLVARYIDPIRAHDASQNAQLLHTLRTYFDHQRSITATAAALGVHRHTVTQRLASIAKLTGANPLATEGLTRLWVALQCCEPSHHQPPGY